MAGSGFTRTLQDVTENPNHSWPWVVPDSAEVEGHFPSFLDHPWGSHFVWSNRCSPCVLATIDVSCFGLVHYSPHQSLAITFGLKNTGIWPLAFCKYPLNYLVKWCV